MEPAKAIESLARVKSALAPGWLLAGLDHNGDPKTLKAAYGGPLMASFHKNILNRMVRDLEVRLAVEDFEHEFRILFCPTRVEAHLVARKDSQIEVNSRKSWFASGDSIRTDISWKHTPSEFAELIAASGWTSVTSWTNPGSAYALHLLRATCESGQ